MFSNNRSHRETNKFKILAASDALTEAARRGESRGRVFSKMGEIVKKQRFEVYRGLEY
jgi:hypothetical protein